MVELRFKACKKQELYKGKRYRHDTYIVPQAATAAATALCRTDRADVQPT